MNSKQNLLEKNDINHLLYTLFNLLSENNILANIREVFNYCCSYQKIIKLDDFKYFEYIESETEDFPDETTYKYWNKEKLEEQLNKLNAILSKEKNNILKNTKNLIKKIMLVDNIALFSHDGLILYGPYTSYSIYIDQDTDTKEYTIYLWKKDSNEDGLEFKIKNKEELQKFFEDNDILVEWEENENS